VSSESAVALLEPSAVLPTAHLPAVPPVRIGRRVRPTVLTSAVGFLVAAAVLLLALVDHAHLEAGTDALGGGDPFWMSLAALGVVLLWFASAATMLGAMTHRPPLRPLLAVQVAGSCANHLLPAGAGGLAVNLRFLRRQGLTRESAVGAQALTHAARLLAHLALVGVALVAAPAVVRQARPDAHRLLGGVAVALVLIAGVAAIGARAWRRSGRVAWPGDGLLARVRQQLPELIVVLRNPARALQLWVGALLLPLVSAGIFVAMARGLSVPLPSATLLVVFLMATTVSGLLPSPGGFGALDVTLSAALVAAGAPAGPAVGAVMAYRLATVWVPLIPGAVVLAVLVRRRVI